MEMPKSTIEPGRHICAFTPAGADEEYCSRMSALPSRNERCNDCRSKWRWCRECARTGTITGPQCRAVDPVSGLCETHGATAEPVPATPSADHLLATLREGGENLQHIPVEQIRPRSDQPRQHFDEKELVALAESLRAIGQQQPAMLLEIEPDEHGHRYELDDGERRWRACKIAGITTLRAVVFPSSTEPGVRFMRSVVANFSRSDHTHAEEIDLVVRLKDEFGFTASAIQSATGMSEAWVHQRYSLRRLHPKVRARLDPTLPSEERLGIVAALRLAPLPLETQVALLPDVLNVGQHMLGQVIRAGANKRGQKLPRGRRRSHDRFRAFERAVKTAQDRLQVLLEEGQEFWDEAFVGRADPHRHELLRQLEVLQKQVETVHERVRTYHQPATTAAE